MTMLDGFYGVLSIIWIYIYVAIGVCVVGLFMAALDKVCCRTNESVFSEKMPRRSAEVLGYIPEPCSKPGLPPAED